MSGSKPMTLGQAPSGGSKFRSHASAKASVENFARSRSTTNFFVSESSTRKEILFFPVSAGSHSARSGQELGVGVPKFFTRPEEPNGTPVVATYIGVLKRSRGSQMLFDPSPHPVGNSRVRGWIDLAPSLRVKRTWSLPCVTAKLRQSYQLGSK